MRTLVQILAVTAIGLSTLPRRITGALLIGLALAVVVLGTFYFFALFEGVSQDMMAGSDPGRAVITSAGQWNEGLSRIAPGWIEIIAKAPGLRRTADGRAMVDAEVRGGLPSLRRKSDGAMVRPSAVSGFMGMGPMGFALRPELRLVSGRMFRPGTNEIIVGVTTWRNFSGLSLGDQVTFRNASWTVVGSFASGSFLDTSLIGDVGQVMPAMGRESYNSVIAQLASPESFQVFHDTVLAALPVSVMRQTDFTRQFLARGPAQARVLAYVIGFLLTVGAFAAILQTMYQAVDSRSPEMAVLQAIGFGGFAVASAVVLEAMLMAILGAAIGTAISWAWLDGTYFRGVLRFAVTPHLFLFAVEAAIGIAFLGAVLPAIRAARQTVAEALR